MPTNRKRISRIRKSPDCPPDWEKRWGPAWQDPGVISFLCDGDVSHFENKFAGLVKFDPERVRVLWRHFKPQIMKAWKKKDQPWAARFEDYQPGKESAFKAV